MLEEDLDFLIKNSCKLLSRINLPESIYVQVLPQQFRGQAASWWQNIKGLGLEREGFKKELQLRFDSKGVKVLLGEDASRYHHLHAILFHLHLHKSKPSKGQCSQKE